MIHDKPFTLRGLVLKSTGSWYTVQLDSGQIFECRTKGKLRLEESKNTNPIAVGDWVIIEKENDQEASIASIEPRKNYLVRKSTNLSKQKHVIASNVDQLILVVTLFHPQTSLAFIDRYLATAEAYKIEPILIFNKSDLYQTKSEISALEEVEALYQKVGYKTLQTSVIKDQGLSALKNLLVGKTSVFSGHSGVGKSSLLHAIDPELSIKVGHLSQAHHKGMHTTTYAEMFPLKTGGYMMDTPGIKSFGLAQFEKEFLSHYFPEIFAQSPQCKYYNCKHLQEPGCAVTLAVEQEKIALSRYESYLGLYMDQDHKYRA